VPRLTGDETEQLSPSWEKVRRCAEDARGWLDSIFLLECGKITPEELAARIHEVRTTTNKQRIIAVIDDCQRVGDLAQPLRARLLLLTEQLYALAKNLNAALLAVLPDVRDNRELAPPTWPENASGADVVMVMEPDAERMEKLSELPQAINIHLVKNRGGERGRLSFAFHPAFARFTEVS
jgi:replicative DNA helicase